MAALKINQVALLPKEPRPIISIGAGGIVNDAHQPAYQKAGFKTLGIFDLNQKQAEVTANKFAIPSVYTSLGEAVSQAPDNAVFDVAVPAAALEKLLPQLPDAAAVLIQKPMGDSFAQAKTIRAICQDKGLQAAVNFQMRYAPYVLAARSLIEQGAIGEVHDMEIRIKVNTPWHLWHFFETLPRVEILYHSIHYIDIIRAFLGEPSGLYAKTVSSPTSAKLASTRSNIIMDYGNHLRANISTNHGHAYGLKNQESYIAWEGTKGAIKATIGLLLNYPEGKPDAFEYCILQEGQEPGWTTQPISGTWFPDAFIGSMASLMRYLEGSSDQLPTHIDDAFKTMTLVEAAHRSSDAGGVPILL